LVLSYKSHLERIWDMVEPASFIQVHVPEYILRVSVAQILAPWLGLVSPPRMVPDFSGTWSGATMSRTAKIALLALCMAVMCGFVAFGTWWSKADSPATARHAWDGTDIAMLETQARNEPAKAMNFTRLGEAYKASGRLAEAVSAYVSAAELAPGDPDIQRALISLKAVAETTGRH
jgi:hypothetical protein